MTNQRKKYIHTRYVITDQKISMSKLSLFIQKHNENGHHQHNKHEMAIKRNTHTAAAVVVAVVERKMESLCANCMVGVHLCYLARGMDDPSEGTITQCIRSLSIRR